MRIEHLLVTLLALATSCGSSGLISESISAESPGDGVAVEMRRDDGLPLFFPERNGWPERLLNPSSTLPNRSNQLTRMFLDKVRNKHPMYASLDVNQQGDCIGLSIYPCWSVTDDEVQDFVMLNHLRSLGFKADALTDAGLQTLERLPHLEKLSLRSAKQITPEGLDRLKRAKPKLTIELH